MYCLYVGFDYTYIDVNAQGIKSFLTSHVWSQAVARTYTYINTYTNTYIHIYIYMCVCVCVCVCIYVCMYVCTYLRACVCVCVCYALCICITYVCVHMRKKNLCHTCGSVSNGSCVIQALAPLSHVSPSSATRAWPRSVRFG